MFGQLLLFRVRRIIDHPAKRPMHDECPVSLVLRCLYQDASNCSLYRLYFEEALLLAWLQKLGIDAKDARRDIPWATLSGVRTVLNPWDSKSLARLYIMWLWQR